MKSVSLKRIVMAALAIGLAASGGWAQVIGDFETGLDFWEAASPATGTILTTDTSWATLGTHSLKVTQPDGTNAWQTVMLANQETVLPLLLNNDTFTVDVRTLTGDLGGDLGLHLVIGGGDNAGDAPWVDYGYRWVGNGTFDNRTTVSWTYDPSVLQNLVNNGLIWWQFMIVTNNSWTTPGGTFYMDNAVLTSSRTPAGVLLDEPEGGWAGTTQNNTVLTAIDTLASGDLTYAWSGHLSAKLMNAAPDQPSVQFSGAAPFSLGAVQIGTDRLNLWYRTNAWSGNWTVRIYMDTGGLVEVLNGTLDGGGGGGALIADDWWHEASAILAAGPAYDATDKTTAYPVYVRLEPVSGPGVAHSTHVDRIQITSDLPSAGAVPVGTLIDEPNQGLGAWHAEILVGGWTTFTAINTNETGDPSQAVSGVLSARLDDVVEDPLNNVGWPSVRFDGGASFPLSRVKLGSQPHRLNFWYRTADWPYTFDVDIWAYNQQAGGGTDGGPFILLQGTVDGGGAGGALIADGAWHPASAPLAPAITADPADKDFAAFWPDLTIKNASNPSYVWFHPTSGYGAAYSGLYIDLIEIAETAPTPTGACCVMTQFGSGTCSQTLQEDCAGNWLGPLTSCGACTYCPKPFGDTDGDGDMDQDDFGVFQSCYTGIDGGILPGGCHCFNREGNDNDVDGYDLEAFEACAVGGPAVKVSLASPPPGCVP